MTANPPSPEPVDTSLDPSLSRGLCLVKWLSTPASCAAPSPSTAGGLPLNAHRAVRGFPTAVAAPPSAQAVK
jgi:hypothetical protein